MYSVIDGLIKHIMPCRYQRLDKNETDVIGIFLTDGGIMRGVNGNIAKCECLCSLQFQLKVADRGLDICKELRSLDGLHHIAYDDGVILGIEVRNRQHYIGLTDNGLHLFNVDFLIYYK